MIVEAGWLRALDSGDVADPAILGGKGASLARLVSLGYRVPPGFVITTDAFLAVMRHLGVDDAYHGLTAALARGEARYDLAEELGAAVAGSPLPEALLHAVADEATRLVPGTGGEDGLIVRSSATMEDSSASSFAGIFESITVADTAATEAAVRRVWSSAFSRRALVYALERDARSRPSMAVVVQRFLAATRSGVMFTTFDGSTLVEHVEGGCEKLVLGEVIPDRMTIDRSTRSIRGDTTGLSGSHVATLHRLAERLERDFGGPQDVEWVIRDGKVHVVQTRPITASSTAPAVATSDRAVLTGVGASAGTGSGATHLVFNIDQALALQSGSVLVTPMTNPDMVVAMRSSAGIVTDVGGVICHAAIVSRELGLPCVVGTETATTTLLAGQVVTVDGSAGAVYDGYVDNGGSAPAPPAGWQDVWAAGHAGAGIPLVSGVAALEAAPPGTEVLALVPDVDLRSTDRGLWNDLESLAPDDLATLAANYVVRVQEALAAAGVGSVHLVDEGLPAGMLQGAVDAAGDERITVMARSGATPLVEALVTPALDSRQALPPVAAAVDAATDTEKFFGHRPTSRRSTMPASHRREGWWRLLPEYGRFHQESGTVSMSGEYDWLEIRPELVISPLLKSLVQPGFEMVPRCMGFPHLPPLHVKWIRCRYHFRSDAFAAVWEAIVRATWDPDYMADMNRRVRRSYDQLGEVLALFPGDEQGLQRLTGTQMVALITSWWPRWVEFFALCWFIQAQGDDILYPFIDETVKANLEAIGNSRDVAWPGAADLVAPTTPVLSGEYMASMGRLRDEMLRLGLATVEAALDAIGRGDAPALSDMVGRHLAEWHWMRDRDLVFEPWDTPQRVLGTALRTGAHSVVDYDENLRRNLMALGFHGDLAAACGRRQELVFAVRNLHDLNVERENHHVLWLKYSYPLRRVFLEMERRLVAGGAIGPGDIWFFQAPELIDIAGALPAMPAAALVERARNRRHGFELEARLVDASGTPPIDEDDYY